jgi:hypothetical protein
MPRMGRSPLSLPLLSWDVWLSPQCLGWLGPPLSPSPFCPQLSNHPTIQIIYSLFWLNIQIDIHKAFTRSHSFITFIHTVVQGLGYYFPVPSTWQKAAAVTSEVKVGLIIVDHPQCLRWLGPPPSPFYPPRPLWWIWWLSNRLTFVYKIISIFPDWWEMKAGKRMRERKMRREAGIT